MGRRKKRGRKRSSRKKRGSNPGRYWIQEAIKKPGALKRQIRAKYGKRAFTKKGTIKVEFLRRAAKAGGKIGRRARLALTLRKLRRGK